MTTSTRNSSHLVASELFALTVIDVHALRRLILNNPSEAEPYIAKLPVGLDEVFALLAPAAQPQAAARSALSQPNLISAYARSRPMMHEDDQVKLVLFLKAVNAIDAEVKESAEEVPFALNRWISRLVRLAEEAQQHLILSNYRFYESKVSAHMEKHARFRDLEGEARIDQRAALLNAVVAAATGAVSKYDDTRLSYGSLGGQWFSWFTTCIDNALREELRGGDNARAPRKWERVAGLAGQERERLREELGRVATTVELQDAIRDFVRREEAIPTLLKKEFGREATEAEKRDAAAKSVSEKHLEPSQASAFERKLRRWMSQETWTATIDDLTSVLRGYGRAAVSLDADRGEPGSTLEATLIADEGDEEQYSDRQIADLRADLDLITSVLESRERMVIRALFGLETGSTVSQTELSKRMGISPTRITQLRQRALEQLRDPAYLYGVLASHANWEIESADLSRTEAQKLVLEALAQRRRIDAQGFADQPLPTAAPVPALLAV